MNQFFYLTAVASLVTAQISAHAGTNDELFSGSATMGGLTYQLVDLTPDDGETPWIQFSSASEAGYGLLSAYGHEGYRSSRPDAYSGSYPTSNETFYTGQFPASPTSVQSGDGLATASATNSSVTVSVHANANHWNYYGVRSDNGTVGMDVSSSARIGSYHRMVNEMTWDRVTNQMVVTTRPPSEEPFFNYTVSANTRLVLSGTWSFQSSSNLEKVASLPASTAGVYADVYMNIGWTHALVDLNGTSWDSVAELEAAEAAANPTGSAFATSDANGGPSSQTLSAAVDNTSATAQRGFLVLNQSILGYVADYSHVSPAPEPGTYALMGLGLVGIAWAARRRQRT